MTPTIDTTACTPVSIEAPAGISEGVWYRTAAAASGVHAGTVFIAEASERETSRFRRSQDVYRDAVHKQLSSLLRLEPSWDSYGAPTISPIAAESAIRFLAQLRNPCRPSVVPTAKGGVQLEWHHGDVDVELECFPSGHAHLFAENLALREKEDRWVVPGHPAIDAWLRRVSPHD